MLMLKQFTRFILPFAIAVSVAGCTNTPKVTRADIPLVHSSLAYSLKPDEELAINIPRANIYFATKESFSIRFDGSEYTAIKHYVSATGNNCIRFSLTEGEASASTAQKKVTTCQRDGQWRVIAPLVATANAQGE